MSEENVTPETTEENVPATTEETPEQEGLTLDKLKYGYVVGMAPDGNLVFETFGTDLGVMELLGVNYHATNTLQAIYSERQNRGDKLTLEVGKLLVQVDQKLTQLVNKLDPPKPDNKL